MRDSRCIRQPPAQLQSASSAAATSISENEDEVNDAFGKNASAAANYFVGDDISWRAPGDQRRCPSDVAQRISAQHEEPVRRSSVTQGNSKQAPAALTLRPDDYTLKQPPRYSAVAASSAGGSRSNGERAALPPTPPPRQPKATTITVSAPVDGRIDESATDQVTEGRLAGCLDDDDDNDDSPRLDNVVCRSPVNDNNNMNHSYSGDNNGLTNAGYFSTSLLPPSPAPNDDDGGSYDDDMGSSSREATQAIAIYT